MHRDIGPGAHRDSDLGFGQGRCIVDAVACHRDDLAFLLQAFHDVACLPALGFGLMPKIIAAFREEYPSVLVRFEVGSSAQVRDQIARGQCDIGFAADEVNLEGMTATPIVTTDAVVAMPAGHPLAKQRRVGLAALCDYPFIALSRSDTTRRQLDELLAADGRTLRLACETPYSITVASLSKNGVGIGLVNPLALDELDRQGVTFRPLDRKITFRTLALQVGSAPLSLPAQAFLIQAKQILGALSPGSRKGRRQ